MRKFLILTVARGDYACHGVLSGPRFEELVHHTDAMREYAYDRQSSISKLDKALDEGQAKGWTIVNMKQDWRAVYTAGAPVLDQSPIETSGSNHIVPGGLEIGAVVLQQRTAGPALVPRAPLGDQVVYPNIEADEAGRSLDGANKYILHIDSEPLAQFWTLTSYTGGTEIGRCDARQMTRNKDASLTVFVQHTRPGGRAINWLTVPKGGFTMTMRFYGPYRTVLDGVWRLPPVQRRETQARSLDLSPIKTRHRIL